MAAQRQRRPSFGYTRSVYWFAVDLENAGPESKRFILEIAYPVLDRLDLYLIRASGQSEHFASGDLLPFAQRPFAHRNFLFPVRLAEQETIRLYLRVATSSSLQVPITLWQETAFWLADQQFLAMLWLYYGIMLAMLLYNLFIWLVIRDRAYLFYVLFIASFVVFQLTLRGVSYQYLWPQFPWLNEKMLTLPLSAAITFAALFTIDLLRLKTENRRLLGICKPRDLRRHQRFKCTANTVFGFGGCFSGDQFLWLRAGYNRRGAPVAARLYSGPLLHCRLAELSQRYAGVCVQ
ncbi:MAG: 7TM-DISM domain-containing protein [Candidatus Competibacteraceae bacterium]